MAARWRQLRSSNAPLAGVDGLAFDARRLGCESGEGPSAGVGAAGATGALGASAGTGGAGRGSARAGTAGTTAASFGGPAPRRHHSPVASTARMAPPTTPRDQRPRRHAIRANGPPFHPRIRPKPAVGAGVDARPAPAPDSPAA